MAIATLTYDPGARAVVAVQSSPSATATFSYDGPSSRARLLDVRGVVTTLTYLASRSGSLDNRLAAACANDDEGSSLESRLIRKLLVLLQNPPPTGKPLWWHVWKTVAEDQWLRSEQTAMARRLVLQQQLVDEMCQFSTIHLGRVFERWPSLGLALDELPSQFPRRARRIIRRDFITWLRVRSKERRRIATWPTRDFIDVCNVELVDQLEIAAAISGLPLVHRDVVEMRSFGYRRSEIARALNLSIRQVDRIFNRCRDDLRRRLRALRPG